MRAAITWPPPSVTVAIIVFLSLWVAQPGYTAPQSETTPSAATRQLGAIKGSVTDAVTNKGLRKAYLILGGSYASITDDHGNFAFEAVKPGSYVLEAEHQGYIDGHFGEAGEPIKIKLAPGQTLADIKIELTPQAVITGHVVNEDGDIWTHATVNMFRSKWSHGHRTIQGFSGEVVDDQGEFRISQVPPGKYYLAAEPDSGWETRNRPSGKNVMTRQPTWYSNSPDLEGATPIIVGPGNQISGLEIRLRRGSTHCIRGKLLGVDNVPPPDEKTGRFGARRVSAHVASAAAVNSKSGTIRSDGTFEIAGVPSGTYELNVDQGSWFTNNNVNLASVKVRVDDQDLEDVSIELIAPRPVKGVIEISEKGSLKPSGHIVQLESGIPGWSPEAVSRADGSFDFALVSPARHRIQVLGNGFYLKEIRYGDVVSNDGTISFTGAEGRLVLLLSTLGARLTGTAIRTSGDKASRAKAQVVLISNRVPARFGTFDQTGTFTFQDVAPGTYKLYAFEGVPDGAWDDSDFMKELGDAGVEIQLTEGEVKSADVRPISVSDLAPILKKLGME